MTPQGLRFTLNRDSRHEILARLAALNARCSGEPIDGDDRKRKAKNRVEREDKDAVPGEMARQRMLFPKSG